MVDVHTLLYRYLSADRFIEMVFSNSLAVINPSLWVDSFEKYWLNLLNLPEGKTLLYDYVERKGGNPSTDAETIMQLCQYQYDNSFCLCFSALKDAEVLWSAKSYSNKSVMFETTAGKLIELVPSGTVERVQYDLESNTIDDFLSRFDIFPEAISHFNTDQLLLHKRKCFSYEEELRLIMKPDEFHEGKIIKYPIPDLRELINGVMVHPLATPETVGLIEVICNTLQLPFWGKSKVYDFAPL